MESSNGPIPGPSEQPPELSGAVDLDNPILRIIRTFTTEITMAQAASVVCVASNEQGQVMLASHAPGGLVAILGLLSAGSHLAVQQRMRQQVPPEQPPTQES